jgi:hypothetical protein
MKWVTKPRMQEVKESAFESLGLFVERLSPVLSDRYVLGRFLDVFDCDYHVFGLELLEAIALIGLYGRFGLRKLRDEDMPPNG